MDVSFFDFELPDELIALRPARPRDSARMLVVHEDGRLEHSVVRNLPDFLRSNDSVVLNDTKVFPARLFGRRIGRLDRASNEPQIEVLVHKRLSADCMLALVRPARKLEAGDKLSLGQTLKGEVVRRGARGEVEIRFDSSGAELDARINAEGVVPLPPYISSRRQTDTSDVVDYQTVFATNSGSIAAPTAGLHFTPRLLARLTAARINREHLTLHVGTGTFLPVTAGNTDDHRMQSEFASLSRKTVERLNTSRAAGGRIVAVGSTSLRTLEAASSTGELEPFSGETDIFIAPGYEFRTAQILLTNFHLPRSTLFMLVSAFCGLDSMLRAYRVAIEQRYRFYSYGDACLLFRKTP